MEENANQPMKSKGFWDMWVCPRFFSEDWFRLVGVILMTTCVL